MIQRVGPRRVVRRESSYQTRREAPCNSTWPDPLDQVTITVIIIYLYKAQNKRISIIVGSTFYFTESISGNVPLTRFCLGSVYNNEQILSLPMTIFFKKITDASGNNSNVFFGFINLLSSRLIKQFSWTS